MPLKDCPFSKLSEADIPRPILPIKIINPHTGLSYATFGIIDTGADESAVPAGIASILGHTSKPALQRLLEQGMERPSLMPTQQSLKYITLHP